MMDTFPYDLDVDLDSIAPIDQEALDAEEAARQKRLDDIHKEYRQGLINKLIAQGASNILYAWENEQVSGEEAMESLSRAFEDYRSDFGLYTTRVMEEAQARKEAAKKAAEKNRSSLYGYDYGYEKP